MQVRRPGSRIVRPRWSRERLAVVALSLALGTAACGGGASNTGVVTTAPGAKTASSSGATPAATASSSSADQTAAAEIDQRNLTFTPNKVTVKVGERVRFKNSEDVIHTVDINGKNISGNMKKGDVVYWTAPKAGTYKVTCDYHPQMNATITVE